MKLVNIDTTSENKDSTSEKDNRLICAQDEAFKRGVLNHNLRKITKAGQDTF